jgi:RNA polymerase sigma-70 factor (ECF subfamily)
MTFLQPALATDTTHVMIPATYSVEERWMAPSQAPQPPEPAAGEDLNRVESTVDLLAQVRGGDAVALERLCLRYLAPLRRWARGRLPKWARDLRDTDDLIQDTLIQTLRHVDAFDHRGPGSLDAYLRQALVNRVRDECRRVSRRPLVDALDDETVFDGPSPLELAVGSQALGRYDAALATLSQVEREAIVARIEMGRSYAEVAEAIGKPTADAARMTVSRALVRLAEAMRREG